jgi:hypothetical protein
MDPVVIGGLIGVGGTLLGVSAQLISRILGCKLAPGGSVR